MSISEIFGVVIGSAGLLGACYMWLMNRNSKIDVLESQVKRLQDDCVNMGERLNKIEDDFYKEIQKIIEGINEIKVSIAELKK